MRPTMRTNELGIYVKIRHHQQDQLEHLHHNRHKHQHRQYRALLTTICSCSLVLPLNMPLKRLLEDLLCVAFEDITVAGDQIHKVPLGNGPDALVEARPILGEHKPVEPLHPLVVTTLGVLQSLKMASEEAACLFLLLRHPAVLLGGR